MNKPILETDRLILRPLMLEDAEIVFKNWTSDPAVAKYMRWNLHNTVEDTKEWLALEEINIESERVYTWGFVLKENGTLIGSGGLVLKEKEDLYELGYNLMKKYWNQGIATEAAKGIVQFAINELNVNKLFACHAKENPASGEVMKKVGFTYTKDGSYTSFDGKRTFITSEYQFLNKQKLTFL